MPDIAFVASAGAESSSASTVTVVRPAGTSQNDLLLAVLTLRGDKSVTAAPSGWTLVRNDVTATAAGGIRQAVYRKISGSSEPADYSWTLDGAPWAATVLTYRGVDTAAPIEVSAVTLDTSGGSTSVVAPSITTAKDKSLIVGAFSANAGTTDLSFTAPAGMTERADRGVPNANQMIADEPQSLAGSTGTRTATASANTSDDLGALLALNKANDPPNAPILTAPAGGATIDRNSTQRFDWDFSDPDAGDSQSKYDLRYRRTDVAKNEIQTVTITGGPTGGTFTLTFDGQTTASISWDATAAAVQTALEGLSNIGVGDVSCTGGPLPGTAVTVEFTGALGNTNVAQMTATSSLTGGTSPAVTVATTQEGVPLPAWTDVTNTTPNTFHDFAAGTFAAGDYEWQVRTYDAQGVVGPYSASGFFTAAAAPSDLTITYPSNGGTVQQAERVDWSTPTQDSFQVRRVADNAGAADTATVYYDSGEVVSTSARSRSVAFETNDRFEHVQVRIKAEGLWSAWASVRVNVSYTPPAAPTVTLSDDDASGSLWVNITNPTPGAGEPTAEYNSVEVDDGDGWERRATFLATNTGWRYWTPISGRDYSGNVRVVAHGDNGTTATTTVPAGTAPVEGFYYGGGGY